VVPRYGIIPTMPPVDVELFGKRYSAPIGIAPMGGPSLVWPGADLLMAKAAQAARIPYTLGVAGGTTIEQVAKVAPDVFWLQLYRFPHNEHAIGFDLIRRAQAAGVQVLTLTVDVPFRTTRSRESYAGLGGEFKPGPRMIYEMLTRPKWLMALLRNGYPRFATIASYVGGNPSTNEVIRFARKQMGGVFTWDEIARYRDKWKGPLTLKGILHPQDAEKAVSLGIEGIWVSNHGGRQIEALAPAIDCLPGVVAAVGKKATVLIDSGIRSGQDVMRALALGAQAAFAGKSFLWSVGAMGDDGPSHLIDLFIEELRASLGQIGARSLAEARNATISHPGAWKFERRK
jgi:L-lactate dehydrogenase (cytochrome)